VIGCGTVFAITTSGKESVVYNFKGGSDGEFPFASVTDVNGVLYGTTSAGGGGSCTSSFSSGCGTIFQLTP
jgi:hypothetical protein